MQTGMITSENHSQILRSISQKRQNGILEVLFSDYQILIFFVNGKIVEAVDTNRNPVLELKEILSRIGFVLPTEMTQQEILTYRDLFVTINSSITQSKVLDENTFKMGLKKRVLDTLYDLRLDVPAVFNLKLQMVEYDRDFAPAISVGQILLDRVSLESEYKRYSSLFTDGAIIKKNELAGISLTEEEQIIFNLVGSGITKKALADQVLLSRYSIQHNLLSMFDRALLEVEQEEKAIGQKAQAISEDILSVLEESSDRPFVESDLKPLKDEKRSPLYNLAVETEETSKSISEKFDPESILQNMDEIVQDNEENEEANNSHFEYAKITKLAIINGQLLQSQYIPNILIFIFMVLACTLPFYLWQEIFAGF